MLLLVGSSPWETVENVAPRSRTIENKKKKICSLNSMKKNKKIYRCNQWSFLLISQFILFLFFFNFRLLSHEIQSTKIID